MWIWLCLMLFWAVPGQTAPLADRDPGPHIRWNGQTFQGDSRFLLRIDGPVIQERWTFPGTITQLETDGKKLLVSWEDGSLHEVTAWKPGEQVPNWVLGRSLIDLVVAPRDVGPKTMPITNDRTLHADKARLLAKASQEDPTNPWYHLRLAQWAQEQGQNRLAETHFLAVMQSPHLIFADWTKMVLPLELLGRPDLADQAFERAWHDFTERGYRPELVRENIYFHLLFDTSSHDFSRLKAERPARHRVMVERVARFMPHLAGSTRFWRNMAEADPAQADLWLSRAQAAWRWDYNTRSLQRAFLASALVAALYLTIWLFSLIWATRPVFRRPTLASLLILAVVGNGLSRWLFDGAFHHLGTPLAFHSGSWVHPDVRQAIADFPESPEREQLLAFADQQAQGRPLVVPEPETIERAFFGPLTLQQFSPLPHYSLDRLAENLALLFDWSAWWLSDRSLHAAPLMAVVAWGLGFLALNRLRLPRFLSLLLPGLAHPRHPLSPWATGLFLFGALGVTLLTTQDWMWGESSMFYLGLEPTGTVPDLSLTLASMTLLCLLPWLWNAWRWLMDR